VRLPDDVKIDLIVSYGRNAYDIRVIVAFRKQQNANF